LLPPLGWFLLAVHLIFVMVRPDWMVGDPGVGWHVRLGQLMVAEFRLPVEDPLSLTFPGKPWMDYQWGTHAVMGLLHGWGGLPLVTAVWALLFGFLVWGLYGRMVRMGVALPLAWLLAFGGYVILTLHIQVRPHVWTYLFLFLLIGWLERAHRLKEGSRWYAACAAIFLPWANLHAGFAAGLVVWAAFGLGEVVAAWSRDRSAAVSILKRNMGWGMLAFIFTLANPYGTALHAKIFSHLDSAALRHWHEHIPTWQASGANIALFVGLFVMVALAAACRVGGARPGLWAAALVMSWFAWTTVRHVCLFVIVALPMAGLAVQALGRRLTPVFAERWKGWAEPELQRARILGWVLLSVLVVLAWALEDGPGLRRDLRGIHVSSAALDWLAQAPEDLSPLVHTEDLGGTIAYELAGSYRVFADDRLDYYGADFFLGTYLPLMRGGVGWEKVLESFGFRGALLRQGSGLAEKLAADGRWEKLWSDQAHVLFRKKTSQGVGHE
jgi:hypothetical protein